MNKKTKNRRTPAVLKTGQIRLGGGGGVESLTIPPRRQSHLIPLNGQFHPGYPPHICVQCERFVLVKETRNQLCIDYGWQKLMLVGNDCAGFAEDLDSVTVD